MKIKDTFILQSVAGENIVVPIGEATLDFNAVVTLNETAAFLFSALKENDLTVEELVKLLTSEYEVDDATATEGVNAFIDGIRNAGLLDE